MSTLNVLSPISQSLSQFTLSSSSSFISKLTKKRTIITSSSYLQKSSSLKLEKKHKIWFFPTDKKIFLHVLDYDFHHLLFLVLHLQCEKRKLYFFLCVYFKMFQNYIFEWVTFIKISIFFLFLNQKKNCFSEYKNT
jgi:hypothetical protein